LLELYGFSSKKALADSRKKSWNDGVTGVVPTNPGNYWIFIRSWRITKIEYSKGILRTSFPKNKRVDSINPDRWGREFT
jgi:hypothetical protein